MTTLACTGSSCATWPSETGQMKTPCWKCYWLLNWKGSKTSPSFALTLRGSLLDTEHTALYMTVVRCFQPVIPSSTCDMINFIEKYWLHPRINFQILKFISTLCCSCQRLKWQAICEKRGSNQRSKKVPQEPQGELKLESVILLFTSRRRSYSNLKWGFNLCQNRVLSDNLFTL